MTADTGDSAKVLARVKKMLTLANDAAASDGERDNAMRMALNLLAKHNLTVAQAEASGAKPEEARQQGETFSRDQPWCRAAAHAVAEVFFCSYFYVRGGTTKRGSVQHCFVGRASNVETAKVMADYVISSIMREANREWKKQADPGPWWSNFCKGAAHRVWERCAALKREAEQSSQAASSGTALVLASVYAMEARANETFLSETLGLQLKTKASREKRVRGEGYAAGRAFGDKVSLNRQVGASQTKRAAIK